MLSRWHQTLAAMLLKLYGVENLLLLSGCELTMTLALLLISKLRALEALQKLCVQLLLHGVMGEGPIGVTPL